MDPSTKRLTRASTSTGHTPTAAGSHGYPPRKKLWEIDQRMHCSIVGTCLTLGDLRRIASRLEIDIPSHFEDYDVHGHFTGSASGPGPVARAMHKALDRKHATAIRRFGKVKEDDEIRALWNRCLQAGEVPGPYWALASHPTASDDVVFRAFGNVHMISHLVGASNQADIRRLRRLEIERDDLSDALSRAKRRLCERETDLNRLAEHHAAEIRDLNLQLRAAQSAQRQLGIAERRVSDLENGDTHRTLLARVETIVRNETVARADADQAKRHLADRDQEIEDLRRTNERLSAALFATVDERDGLEAVLYAGLANGPGETPPELDLTGRRVVYVGGRAGLIPHLRALVERSNGTFLHHDGGLQESEARLGDVLSQGDAILCPVDCVSHGACKMAKRVCRQRATPFVPLRSSGLSAFVSGLREIAAGSNVTAGTVTD